MEWIITDEMRGRVGHAFQEVGSSDGYMADVDAITPIALGLSEDKSQIILKATDVPDTFGLQTHQVTIALTPEHVRHILNLARAAKWGQRPLVTTQAERDSAMIVHSEYNYVTGQ